MKVYSPKEGQVFTTDQVITFDFKVSGGLPGDPNFQAHIWTYGSTVSPTERQEGYFSISRDHRTNYRAGRIVAPGSYTFTVKVRQGTSGRMYCSQQKTAEVSVPVRIDRGHGIPDFLLKWGSPGPADGQFQSPRGIAASSNGKVYVVDREDACVQVFTSDGAFLLKWGSEGDGDGQFDFPQALTVDQSGNVYVADYHNRRIQKFTANGEFLTKWGSQEYDWFQHPWPDGVVVDAAGSVYAADAAGIQKFSDDGEFLGRFGSTAERFLHPTAIATDLSGNLYVGYYESCIEEFDPSGTPIKRWGSYGETEKRLYRPSGIAVDSNGNVFVIDEFSPFVREFTNDGDFLTIWGARGSGDWQFGSYPGGVAVDSGGCIYVTDPSNTRVQKFAPSAAAPAGPVMERE